MDFIVLIIGLIIGSFLSALTDRWPKEVSIFEGRSKCPKCKKRIEWYDNIPLFSFLILGGKCRKCKKPISFRYPLIEVSTAFLFLLSFRQINLIKSNLIWISNFNNIIIFILVFIFVSIFVAIFVIDLEHQYIPDRLTFWGLGIFILALIFSGNENFYLFLINGFAAALFLLILHIATFGRGMGLGDVKLAIFIGSLFSYQLTILWMLLSFIIGSIVGVGMLAFQHAKLKQQIPFGPFLITAALIVFFFGNNILSSLFYL